jgi:hypothetical protein
LSEILPLGYDRGGFNEKKLRAANVGRRECDIIAA